MTLYAKMRALAFQDATIRSFLGENLADFRWYYIQVPIGIIGVQTCVRVITVGQISTNLHTRPIRNRLTGERVQIDAIDKRPSVAAALADAIDTMLNTADFVGNGAFSSPPISTYLSQNAKLNQRGGLDYQTQRPTPVESLDYRITNVAI